MRLTQEREITAPVDLCDARGRLNPAAVGWTRRPWHRSNLRGWGRTKRWEYWGVVTSSHVVALTVSDLDYAGVHAIYVLDRVSGEETVREATVALARGVVLPDRSGSPGSGSVAVGRGLRISLCDDPAGTSLVARAEGVDIELYAARPSGQESLGVVVPWSSTRFQYTVKDVARPVSGRLVLSGREVAVSDGFAVLDHGRGRWPYAMTWNWAAGSGLVDAVPRGVQLGGRWTSGTGSTENALLVDGRISKIGEELDWTYDPGDWMRPWRIRGERVDLTVHPFHDRASHTNLLVVGSTTHQCFGEWEGWGETDDGERVRFDGLLGWAEEARNRW